MFRWGIENYWCFSIRRHFLVWSFITIKTPLASVSSFKAIWTLRSPSNTWKMSCPTSYAGIVECFLRLRAQNAPELIPRIVNEVSWCSLEVDQTLSSASRKLLSISTLRLHLVAGKTSVNFHQLMEGTIWICKGWIGFSKSSEKSSRSLTFSVSLLIARFGRHVEWISWRTEISLKFAAILGHFPIELFSWMGIVNFDSHCYVVVGFKQ